MAQAALLGRDQRLAAVGADAVADRGHLRSQEELEPGRCLLHLDPLAADQEAVAPAAHSERFLATGDVGGEQRLWFRPPLLGAQASREENEAPRRVSRDVDVHLPFHLGAVTAKGKVDAAHLVADAPHQHPLQFFQLLTGDEIPEQAPEAVPGASPAVVLGEAVVPLVDLDQVVVLIDRVAENRRSDQ